MNERPTRWWRSSRTKLPLIVFLAVAAYFLWTEHRAHAVEYLPWLLVLACVGMHLLMHGGHGHGTGHRHDAEHPDHSSSRDDPEGRQ